MMEKGKPVSIPYYLTKSAIGSGFETIMTVPPFKRIKIRKIIVQFPSGTGGELRVALYYGLMKVAPETDYYAGDDARFEDEIDVTYYSGDPIRIWWELTVAVARKANIKLEGELVE